MYYLIFSLFIIIIPCFIIGILTKNNDDIKNPKFLNRYNTTVCKGLAIIFIILSHLGAYFGLRILTPLGGIGVAIFLILTGYGLLESYIMNGLNCFWWKKIVKIFFPYFIVESIFLISQKIDLNFYNLFLDYTLIKPVYPYSWFLNFLLLNYFIFFIVFSIKIQLQNKIFIFGIISILIYVYSNEIRAEQAISVFLGILMSNYKNKLIKYKKKNWLMLFFIIGITFLSLKQLSFIREFSPIIFNAIQLFIKVPLGLFVIFSTSHFNHAFLYFLGNISFEIYLIHAFTIRLISTKVTFSNITFFLILTLFNAFIFSKILNLLNTKRNNIQ